MIPVKKKTFYTTVYTFFQKNVPHARPSTTREVLEQAQSQALCPGSGAGRTSEWSYQSLD